MGVAILPPKEMKKLSWKTIAKDKLNYDAEKCPCCTEGKMVTLFHFKANAPPDTEWLKALIKSRMAT